MGSIAKQLAKHQKRKQIKQLKQVFMDERRLHERLLAEGLMESSQLVGKSVKSIDWDRALASSQVPQVLENKLTPDDLIDLEWEDDVGIQKALDSVKEP